MTDTSQGTARRKFRWAMVLQLAVIGHAVLATFYAATGQALFAASVFVVIVFLSYGAISLAFDGGTYWPNGCRRCNDADA